MNKFVTGDRVKVICAWQWPGEPTGTVMAYRPRKVTLKGKKDWYYVIRFDKPEHDSSPDGPYAASEVSSADLTKL